MIQCADCEFGKVQSDGTIRMTCQVARNIKEEACLTKWMLVKLTNIERMQAHTLSVSDAVMPLQAKLLRHGCNQIDELQEGESWKRDDADEDEPSG